MRYCGVFNREPPAVRGEFSANMVLVFDFSLTVAPNLDKGVTKVTDGKASMVIFWTSKTRRSIAWSNMAGRRCVLRIRRMVKSEWIGRRTRRRRL